MLSVVIPLRNEQDSLPCLYKELVEVFQGFEPPLQMVFVDDASGDDSRRLLEEISRRDSRVCVVKLPDHRGQSAALAAGIAAAGGEILASVDADLQYDLADLRKMVEHLNGQDMICAFRQNRADGAWKDFSSRAANALRRALLKDTIRDAGCTLRVWKREAMDGIFLFDGFHRFFSVLFYLKGRKVNQVGVQHRPRHGGHSHYGTWRRAYRGCLDMIGVRRLCRGHVASAGKWLKWL